MIATACRRLAVVALFFCLMPLAAETLPRPPGLEPDIAFWRRIFTEVTTDQALVHDNRYLSIVYEKLDLPADASPAKQRRVSDTARAKYERILRTLASGKREGLTSEESRVLGLWHKGITNAELRAAAERIRFQQGLADRFYAGLVRSGQWRDHIKENLRAAGVPEDLVALPHVESSFNPEAYSYVGAAGLWQFTRDTGRRFMQVDHVVDERRDPYESSRAAARLLKYNYSIIGSWPLAITGYNHGLGGMRKAVQRMGTDDIEVIVRRYDGPAFGFASRNFYVSFLAALDVDREPEKYFGRVRRNPPRNDLVVELPDYMKIETLERAFGVSRSILQAYNPALLPPVWEGAKYVPRGFRLRLPGDLIEAPVERVLDSIPETQRFAAQVPDRTHRVARGETLSGIAARYRTSVAKLMAANGLRDARRIRIGQTLRLPGAGAAPGAAVLASAAKRAAAASQDTSSAAAAPAAVEAVPPRETDRSPAEVYVVRRGDSLSSIARRSGLTEQELMARNGITNRNLIRVGQKLSIGRAAAAPVAGAAAPTQPSVVANASAAGAAPASAVAEASPPAPQATSRPGELARGAQFAPASRAPPPIVLAPFVAVVPPAAPESAATPPAGLAVAAIEPVTVSPADPSDYLVAEDGTVEVQATETLSHYAEWLEVSPDRLRKANNWSRRRQPVLGQRLRLVFTRVDRETFTQRRIAHHRGLQEQFFSRYRITDTTEHQLRSGESVWALAQQKYKVPVWLLRQYNPDLKLDQVRPGMRVIFPRLEVVTAAATEPVPTVARARCAAQCEPGA